MKISYNWLKELVDIDLSPRELATRLTMVGLAVDGVEEHSDDFVLDIDLTSNRPDCLSHLGMAREAAAVSGKRLQMPAVKFLEAETKSSEVTSVEILAPELCPRYSARVIKGVKIGPSPEWLVNRLAVMGQRSVNNVADITNYVMLEMGQPLHAFDFEMLRGKRIIVRTGRDGETMTTLDGEERVLTSQMLVIADAERAVALAGIKGGEDSGISDQTVDVLLEAAYFTPSQVRATSKALGLSTEASYRFERGTDPEIVAVASNRAAAMIAEIAGGEILGDLVDVYQRQREPKQVTLRRARYELMTGLPIGLRDAENILRSLGMKVEADVEQQTVQVVAPSWRIDIAIEEDLIEEVARITGYDKLQSTLPGSAGAGAYLPGEDRRRTLRKTLTALGYHEAVSFSFVNGDTDQLLSDVNATQRLVLRNPIDETQGHLRVTLLGGLLKALEHNFNHGQRNVRLFEIGKTFMDLDEGASDDRPSESESFALIATGARNENDWRAAATQLDFYDLKGAIEAVGEALGVDLSFDVELPTGLASMHPGRTARIWSGTQPIGDIGQLHPRVAAQYKFKQPVFMAELSLEALLSGRKEVRYQPLPKYPAVVRDLALLLAATTPFEEVKKAIEKVEIPELISVRLFDLYAGKELPAGKHSIALSLRYRAADRTLTDEEVNAMHERVVHQLKQEFAVEVR